MATVRAKAGAARSEAEESRVDVQVMNPGKYEVKQDDTFTITVCLVQVEGRWRVVEGPGRNVAEEKVVFAMWRYNDAVELRKKATAYDRIRRMHVVDHDALNRLKVQKYLLSWTFDKDNPRLKLHRVNGVLTDESWDMFSKSLYPNITSRIIEEMNRVYEFNG
jgi:hypothetical protein